MRVCKINFFSLKNLVIMPKNISNKLSKLIKYYSLINHNLIFSNNSINRYNQEQPHIQKDKAKNLQILRDRINDIKDCKLKENASNLVFSDGNPNSKIMIIGEGPGANEDKEGFPFVGRAGQLLDKMLLAINLSRKNVYITNVVNYRPPENRNPELIEIESCSAYLDQQISNIKPKVIVLLGKIAANKMLGQDKPISELRLKKFFIDKYNIPMIVFYHPAYILRSPLQKKKVWEDLQHLNDILSSYVS